LKEVEIQDMPEEEKNLYKKNKKKLKYIKKNNKQK